MRAPRIEVAGLILKPSGKGWAVGERVPRMIGGRATENVRDPTYTSNARLALPYLLGRAQREIDQDGRDWRHLELLDALRVRTVEMAGAALLDPGGLARLARWDTSQRRYAERAGVARSTLQDVEAGRVDPLCSTLARLLQAGGYNGS